ncbi:hypothetical protein Dcar01_03526 [Deinococcus carri]|uniref:Phage tail tape measure protein domain-containing protein n=1 Tax=Deinococcus carri TaxID=1211323 RepID=A0ABP9WDF6_9DEIO
MTRRSLGSLTATSGIDRTGFQRDLQALRKEAQQVRVEVPAAVAKLDTAAFRAASQVTLQSYREQAAAAKATAAEQTAAAAKARTELAQLAVTTRLSAQADREAAQVARTAMQARREEIDRVKLSMARLRAEFDDGLKDEQAYHAQNQKLINQLREMGERADFTTRELKQLADMHARLAREGNTIAGVVNPAGLSGNVVTALQGALPGILQGFRGVVQMSPSIGAAASQVTGIAQALGQVRVAAEGALPRVLQMGQGLSAASGAASLLRGGANAAGGAVSSLGAGAVVAGGMVGGLAVAVGAAGAAANKAVNEYARFEEGLARVATLTDKTTAQLGNTGRAVLKLSAETGTSFQQLNAGLYDILGAGVAGTEDLTASMALLRQATMLAKAGVADASVATDVLTSVLNAYKMTASDAGKVSDMLFRAVDQGKMSFEQLATSLGMVLPVAAQAGIGLDEVLAAIAAMTAQGIRPSSSIEYLRSAISNIIKPSEQAANMAKDLGIQFDVQALKSKGLLGFLQEVERATKGNSAASARLFGDVGALTAVTSLASGEFGRFKEALDGQTKSAGATAEAYGKIASTLKQESDKLDANWKALWAGVGEVFAPFKKGIMADLNEMLGGINTFLERWNVARNVQYTEKSLAQMESSLAAKREYLAGGQRIISGEDRAPAALREDWKNRRLPNTLREIQELEAQIVAARAALAQARADATAYNLANGKAALPSGVQGPRFGGDYGGQASGAPISGAALVALLGLGGRRVLNDFGVSGANYKHDGAVRADATHNGIDYGAPRGTPILAPFAGTLSFRQDAKNGKIFELVDSAGNKLVGLHLDAFDAEVVKALTEGGKKAIAVAQGARIGTVGNTGTTAGSFPHLHLMGYAAGSAKPVNPTGLQFAGAEAEGAFSNSGYGKRDGASTTTPPPPKDTPVTAAQIVKAQQLAAALERAQEALKKDPKSVPLTQAVIKATRELNKFKEASDSNAEALAAIQKEGVKTSGTYQATAADLKKYGTDALRLYKDLQKAEGSGSAEAVRAAQARVDAWVGESKAKKAVFDAEGAAYKVRQQNSEQARRDTEQAARDQAQAAREAQQRADQRRELERKLNADIAAGNLESAKANAARLKQSLDTELAAHKSSAADRLRVEQQLGPQILAAQKRVLELERKQAEDAAHATANKQRAELTREYGKGKEPADLLKKIAETETTAVANAGKTFDTQLAALHGASAERINSATAAVQAKNKQVADQRVQTEKQVTQQLAGMNQAQRQAQVQAEEDALTRLRNNRQARINAAKGNAAQLLQIERETAGAIQAQEQKAATTRLIAAKRQAAEEKQARLDAIPKNATATQREALEAAAQTEYLGKLSNAYRAYSLAVSSSQQTAVQAVREAQRTETDKVRSLRDEYSRLAETIRQKVQAGTFDEEAQQEAVKSFNALGRSAEEAGLTQNAFVEGARRSAWATIQAGKGADEYRQHLSDLDDQMEASGQAQENAAQHAIDLAGTLDDLGDRDGALATLNTALDDVMEAAGRGEVVGEAVSILTGAIDHLNASLDKGALERAGNFLRYITEQAEQAAEAIEHAADAASDDKTFTDRDTVRALGKGGVMRLSDYLSGEGNSFFGERFWTELGEEGRDRFRGELDKLTPEDFATLGESALRGMLDGMGDDEDWAALRETVQAGLTLNLDQSKGYAALGAVLTQFDGLDSKAEGYSDTLKTRLLPELERIRDTATDPALKQMAEQAITYLNSEVDAAQRLRDMMYEVRLANLDRLKESGGIGGQNYIDQRHVVLTEQENARYRLDIQGKTGKALELAEAEHQRRLGDITAEGLRATQQLTWQIADETLQAQRSQEAEDLEERRRLGTVSAEGYLAERQAQAEQGARDEFARRTRGMKEGAPEYIAAEKALQAQLTQIANQGAADRRTLEQKNADDRVEAARRTVARSYGLSGQGELVAALQARVTAAKAALAKMVPEAEGYAAALRAVEDAENDLARAQGGGGVSGWQQNIQQLGEDFASGKINAQQFTEALYGQAGKLREMADAAQAAGNPALAQQFRELADSLHAMDPAVAAVLQKLGKVQTYLGYVVDIAGAFGKLAGAIGETEEEYDSLTGEKLQTPWKDLAANLEGVANAAQKLQSLISDVMAVIANPADIGAWVKLVVNVVSSIADAIAGFKKAQAEVARLKAEFAQANPLLNATDYQKVSIRSRGFFADWFGGGPQVVNEIDKIGLPIAQSLASHISTGISNGFDAYLKTGNMEDFAKALNTELTAGIKDALVQGFLNDPARKNEYADAIKGFTDAWKTHDPAQIEAASQRIYQQTQATTEAAKELAAQLDALDRANGTGRYSPEAIAQQARELAGQRLTIEEQTNELLHTQGLRSTEEYEQEKLRLALERIRLEMEAALAAEGLTAEQIALIQQQYDLQTQQAQADAAAAAKRRAEQQAKDLRDLRMNNAETALGIEERLALASASTEEEKWQLQQAYAQRRLELALKRIDAEEAADLASTELTEEMKEAVREKYALARRDAQSQLDATQLDHQRQQAEQARGLLNSWASTGVSAFMDGLDKADFSSFLNNWKGNLAKATVQAIVEAEITRVMTAQLLPLAERYRLALGAGNSAEALAALTDLRAGVTTAGTTLKPLFDGLAPLWADVRSELKENTAATRENTDATKQAQFQQTTRIDVGQYLPGRSPTLQGRLTR